MRKWIMTKTNEDNVLKMINRKDTNKSYKIYDKSLKYKKINKNYKIEYSDLVHPNSKLYSVMLMKVLNKGFQFTYSLFKTIEERDACIKGIELTDIIGGLK